MKPNQNPKEINLNVEKGMKLHRLLGIIQFAQHYPVFVALTYLRDL